MQVHGNVASVPEFKTGASKERMVFRLAENQGEDPHRTTTWYDVTVFVRNPEQRDELALLTKGQFIKVTGRLTGKNSTKENGEPFLNITGTFKPVEKKEKPAA